MVVQHSPHKHIRNTHARKWTWRQESGSNFLPLRLIFSTMGTKSLDNISNDGLLAEVKLKIRIYAKEIQWEICYLSIAWSWWMPQDVMIQVKKCILLNISPQHLHIFWNRIIRKYNLHIKEMFGLSPIQGSFVDQSIVVTLVKNDIGLRVLWD